MNHLEDLKIWNKAMDLTVRVYENVKHFPKDEMYGLSSQIKRSAVSVASNIAEGAGRNSDKEFRHFLAISQGSAYELQSQLILARRLQLIAIENCTPLLNELDEIQKMNRALQKRLG